MIFQEYINLLEDAGFESVRRGETLKYLRLDSHLYFNHPRPARDPLAVFFTARPVCGYSFPQELWVEPPEEWLSRKRDGNPALRHRIPRTGMEREAIESFAHFLRTGEQLSEIDVSDRRYVCYCCIGDRFLREEVQETGVRSSCFHCRRTNIAWSIEKLAERISEVLLEHFDITSIDTSDYIHVFREDGSSDFRPRGDYIDWIISEIAIIDHEISLEVVEHLHEYHERDVIKYGATDYYDSAAQYEEKGPNAWGFQYTWDAFCNEIRTRARFFSTEAEGLLYHIFGDLSSLQTQDGDPVIRLIDPSAEDCFIWRARKANPGDELKVILNSPIREIGPPPADVAAEGRMNAKGISVFYGAFDPATCVAEIRPPVGSYVVLARFEIVRKLRLLDFDTLARVHEKGSYFDQEYAERKGRAAFLNSLVDDISKPVMPADEYFEYLPTQVVAEYLAHRAEPNLDGIIYRSSQAGLTELNVVLFNHASLVEQDERDRPDIVDISLIDWDAEGDRSIYLRESDISSSSADTATVQDESSAAVAKGVALRAVVADALKPDSRPHLPPTLRMDYDSIKVSRISRVCYEERQFNLHRVVETKARTVSDVEAFREIVGDDIYNYD